MAGSVLRGRLVAVLAMSAPAHTPGFRDYGEGARASVRELYRQNHTRQRLDFVRARKREYLSLDRRRMTIWEALELLETLVDDSDPDIELGQIEHALQTAEAIRADGDPRWFVVTGLVHDLGKVLCSFGEPQWAVVGDTFPLGCGFRPSVVYHELFAENPGTRVPAYSTRLGIYEEGCGLERVEMSWGHDEYLYHVVKERLPPEALAMIRYHSFYAAHREGDYGDLMNERDREMLAWVRAFNPYDLYSKSPVRPDREALEPYYRELVAEFFPEPVRF
jgi:inositol oxygenase